MASLHKYKCLLFIITAIFFLSGCSSSGRFNTFKHRFDRSISGAKFYQSAEKPWSIKHDKEITRSGNGSVRFELRAKDTWWDGFKDSHRTEMRFFESSSGWYGFSMFIPDDGSYLGSKTYVGQWHGVGEGSSVRGKAVHPPISQCFLGQYDNDIMGIKVYSDGGLEYMELIPDFPRGKWVDMVYHIEFSSGKNGILEVWMNGRQIVKYIGPNTYRGAVHLFKFGIYTLRVGELNKPVVVYFDEYAQGPTYESVDPSQGENPKIDM